MFVKVNFTAAYHSVHLSEGITHEYYIYIVALFPCYRLVYVSRGSEGGIKSALCSTTPMSYEP